MIPPYWDPEIQGYVIPREGKPTIRVVQANLCSLKYCAHKCAHTAPISAPIMRPYEIDFGDVVVGFEPHIGPPQVFIDGFNPSEVVKAAIRCEDPAKHLIDFWQLSRNPYDETDSYIRSYNATTASKHTKLKDVELKNHLRDLVREFRLAGYND